MKPENATFPRHEPRVTKPTCSFSNKKRRSGFTLVELMIVVGIIGVLAAIAVPAFAKARTEARVARMANDLRIFGNGFAQYAMDTGSFPVDTHISLPPGMDEYIDQARWDDNEFGGTFNWEGPSWGEGGSYPYAGIALFGASASAAELQALDDTIDDGDLSTGRFRLIAANSRYTYIIEE